LTDAPPPRLPVSRFDYDLPSELIAQRPVEPRDSSRLLTVPKGGATFQDRVFHELPEILEPGDVLVLNDTRVMPARLFARRSTGGRVEILLLNNVGGNVWHALARPAQRLKTGELLAVLDLSGASSPAQAEVVGREPDGEFTLHIDDAESTIKRFGQMPLPPYIAESLTDPERYQTVFADREGSAAAPTAGLHFTPGLLEQCKERRIEIQYVTLHVGLDTFQPLKVEDALDHQMHSEWYHVNAATVGALRSAKEDGRRILAVGTTAARTLETVAPTIGEDRDQSGRTSIYITPKYEFRLLDGMVTNFHLPRTTLLLMVSALAGERTLQMAYQHAIRERYRFYSFGDAMLIV
jgi:S-adenosylmethionine:tRNA ribosyltransferase-isomerase